MPIRVFSSLRYANNLGENDDKQDIITILGTEAGVKKAKAILDKKVAELASIEEKEVVVPEQYHKNFTARRAELINKISSECGGVQISFPRPPKVIYSKYLGFSSKLFFRKVKKSLMLSRSRALVTVSIRQLQ